MSFKGDTGKKEESMKKLTAILIIKGANIRVRTNPFEWCRCKICMKC